MFFARLCFLSCRLLRRSELPLPAARGPCALIYAVYATHLALLLFDLAVTLVLVSELWCVESATVDVVGGGGGGGGGGASFVPGAARCNHLPLALYAALPPAAFLLPTLLGQLALAAQSSRGLRLYAAWNGAALWSVAVAAAVIAAYRAALGIELLVYPASLLAAKLLAAQCVPYELAEIERFRAIRGWRGLFEVRTGAAEAALNAQGG
jgi:hypothetical protein